MCRLFMLIIPFGVVGCVFYFRLGFEILNPFNIGSIMKGDADITQVGWLFFRNDEWRFPLTHMLNFLAPEGTSVVFTDSIPWLAIFFKFVGQNLSAPFQYFGWWLLLAYSLQYLIGEKIGSIFTQSKMESMVIGLFFLITPAFLYRTGHSALAGHWIFLIPIYIHLKLLSKSGSDGQGHKEVTLKVRVYWGLLALSVFSLGVHPYLAVINFVFTLGIILNQKTAVPLGKRIYFLVFYLLALVGAAWSLGYFSLPKATAKYFTSNSTDLLSYFNSFGLSSVLPALRHRWGQGEGLSYLGLGLIGLLGYFILRIIYLKINKYKSLGDPSKPTANSWHRIHYKPLLLPITLFYIYSLSSEISFGGNTILDLSLFYDLLQPIPSTFRAAGRFSWPMTYLVSLWIMVVFLRKLNSANYKVVFLLLIFMVQFIDLLPWMIRSRSSVRSLALAKSFPFQIDSAQNRFMHREHLISAGDNRKNKVQLASTGNLDMLKKVNQLILVPHAYLAIEDKLNCPDNIWMDYYLVIGLIFSNHYGMTSGYAARTNSNYAERCQSFWKNLRDQKLVEGNIYIVHPLFRDRFTQAVGESEDCHGWGDLLVCLANSKNN